MTREAKQNELGTFLKARRAELTPRDADLPEGGGARRGAGRRSEAVARPAALSPDASPRPEQGRIRASAPVRSSLAEVLKLDDDQRRYLFSLAEKPSTRAPRRTVQKVKPPLQRLLDDLAATPAIVMGRRMDVLAWNQLAAAKIG